VGSCFIAACVGLAVMPSFAGPVEDATLTKAGQTAPGFTVKTVDGKEFSLSEAKGKVLLVNFFATWCGPCIAELPVVEKQIWQKYKNDGLVMIAIGREHQASDLVDFQKKHKFSFPMAGDPKREAYSKYATAYIPRTYLINKEGRIVYQSVGFEEKEFKALLAAVEKECGAAK
jgi:peroxiredoxin